MQKIKDCFKDDELKAEMYSRFEKMKLSNALTSIKAFPTAFNGKYLNASKKIESSSKAFSIIYCSR